MHFLMWIQSIVGSVLNVRSISISTTLVLIITLDIHAIVADKYIGRSVVIVNHTTDAIPTTTGTALKPIESVSSTRVLSRRKRFIAFPEGSSFSVAFCATGDLLQS